MLQVIDRTIRVAAPPPSAPALPYRVETFAYGYGSATVHRPTKVRDNGVAVGGDLLAPDEVGVWAHLCWVRTEIARRKGEVVPAEHDPANPPSLPYAAKEFEYGVGRKYLAKVRSGDYSGDLLTPDELAVWGFLKKMEEELEVLVSPGSTTSNSALEAEVPGIPVISNVSAPAPEVLEFAINVVVPETIIPSPAVPGEETTAPVTPNTNTTLTKREQAERALLESPTDNNCVIAERLGVSDELVRRARKELEAAGRLQPVAVLTKRDGTSYAIADAAVGDDTVTG